MTKVFLFCMFLATLIFSISRVNAITLHCREYDDRYDKLSFTEGSGKVAQIAIFKYNIKYALQITGKIGSYDVYESSVTENPQQGKLVFLINRNNGAAAYSLIEVGFNNRLHDSGDSDLICR